MLLIKKLKRFGTRIPVAVYKVVTIDAEVRKEDKSDSSYALEVKGVETLYREGDVFHCKLTIHGTDSYLKFFWFDSNGGLCFILTVMNRIHC